MTLHLFVFLTLAGAATVTNSSGQEDEHFAAFATNSEKIVKMAQADVAKAAQLNLMLSQQQQQPPNSNPTTSQILSSVDNNNTKMVRFLLHQVIVFQSNIYAGFPSYFFLT